MAVPPIPIRGRKRVRKYLDQTSLTQDLSSVGTTGKSKRAFWSFIIVFLMIVLFIMLVISSSFIGGINTVSVPYALHSDLSADYSVDPQNIILPAVKIDLITDYLKDMGVPDPQSRFVEIQQGFNTLVPTITPYLILTATLSDQTNLPTPTPSKLNQAPTITPQVDSNNPTLNAPPLITATFTPTPNPTRRGSTPTLYTTNTITPTSVKSPSTRLPNTPSNPTAPSRTNRPPTSTPTATKIPPTSTKPVPTASSLPPSPTKPLTATKPIPTSTKPAPTSTKQPTSIPETPYP